MGCGGLYAAYERLRGFSASRWGLATGAVVFLPLSIIAQSKFLESVQSRRGWVTTNRAAVRCVCGNKKRPVARCMTTGAPSGRFLGTQLIISEVVINGSISNGRRESSPSVGDSRRPGGLSEFTFRRV